MAREIVVLTNPTSGKGRASGLEDLVVPRLTNAGFEVRRIQGRDADHARELIRQCVSDGVDTLVVIGGDGMIHVAVQELAGTKTALGIVPAGTGNDVARFFGIPADDLTAAVGVIIAGKTRIIDLGRIGARYFISIVAGGLDAIINARVNRMRWPKGTMRYTLATLVELVRFKPISYRIDVDGEAMRVEATTLAIANTSSYGGGMRIAEGAEADDGLLDLIVIGPASPLTLMRTFPVMYKAGHLDHPLFRRWRGRSITIAAPGITAYADGEPIAPLPITADIVPASLRILVP